MELASYSECLGDSNCQTLESTDKKWEGIWFHKPQISTNMFLTLQLYRVEKNHPNIQITSPNRIPKTCSHQTFAHKEISTKSASNSLLFVRLPLETNQIVIVFQDLC